MKRYFQIMKTYLRGSLMYQMEYKFNFLVGGTFELIWMAMYIIFIKIFFICGISNSLNEILNFLLTGFSNKKSKVPLFINSGNLFSPGTTANVNTESISPP